MTAAARPIAAGDDFTLPFQVDALDLRGRVVRLGPAIDALLSTHDYPEPVAMLLGELVVTTALLAGALKFDGILITQIRSDGPVNLIVVDFKTPGHLRAYARFDRREVDAARPVAERYRNPVQCFLGRGSLTFTVDQGPETDRYQGTVELTGNTVLDCAHHYLEQSEQHKRAAACRGKGPGCHRRRFGMARGRPDGAAHAGHAGRPSPGRPHRRRARRSLGPRRGPGLDRPRGRAGRLRARPLPPAAAPVPCRRGARVSSRSPGEPVPLRPRADPRRPVVVPGERARGHARRREDRGDVRILQTGATTSS